MPSDKPTGIPFLVCTFCGEGVTCEHGKCNVCQSCRPCEIVLRDAIETVVPMKGALSKKVMTSGDWESKHTPHLQNGQSFGTKPFDGPHDWIWLVCPCGAEHLQQRVSR